MSFQIDALNLVLLIVVAAIVLGVAIFAVNTRMKARRERRNITVITGAIIDYFRKTGVQVSADCVRPQGGRRYTAIIESEPMKRFRLSHIIEMTVREHVRKSCGLELDKIYWRFPIKETAPDVVAAEGAQAKPAESDEYINEGLEHYRHIPRVEATELPWEHFEQVAVAQEKQPQDPPARQ